MFIDPKWNRIAVAAAAVLASLSCGALHATDTDFPSAVTSTHPLAYFRLDSTGGKSLVGTTIYKPMGSVISASPGAPIGIPVNYFAKLDGRGAYLLTTQAGGITSTASIMAWVKLAELPSTAGHFFYVAGESESGNDFDVQFETDNVLRFYTSGGGNISYTPPPATLVNQWHLIVVTLDTVSGARAIYWDGKSVATDKGGGRSGKSAVFSIGWSTVFGGRFFHGGIEEVALWNRALKATEVTAIYAASKATASPVGPNASAPAAGSSTSPAHLGAAMPTTGPFATKAKIDVEDAKGPIQLKREEQIAYMFISAIEIIEHDCQLTLQHAYPFAQMLSGAYPAGTHMEHLKFDPNKTDPSYVYTLDTNGMAWEPNANPKKPGLAGFCFMARTIGTTTATINPAGPAGWVSDELGNRGYEGDSFATQ